MKSGIRCLQECQCGTCSYINMEKPEECVCCIELERVREKNEGQAGDCITQHPAFQTVCLDPDILDVAYSHYKQHYGPMDKSQNERRRYTAYRQFVRWIWDFLGKYIRVPLPACVVTQVRKRCPSPEFTGFLDVESAP
ncbi:hypothetical protein LOTGIDRAFT_172853 [Lottia gigantea]|uniref:P2X purinoreceptor 7 intracellular domain-containing protein n=1 Tax=Lottia gigantea TaxID=225164 RepID=V4AUM1_LOTGI|nr:hypothetical protein LOTGIDRAFT_172853 [Lottia gigantea]ESP01018.1 hypothetical protein LOTGIDRAFT_172853 [Lottia gigantea]